MEVNEDTLIAYGINITYMEREGGESREIGLAGEATPQAYEEVSTILSNHVHHMPCVHWRGRVKVELLNELPPSHFQMAFKCLSFL